MIEIFVRGANLIGLPRSVGEIYGLLFCADGALTFEDLGDRLGISKGSVSQGLKLLRQLGAVKVQYVAGSRKDHYIPELSIKRLVQGFLRDQFAPHVESGRERLAQARALAEKEPDPAVRKHALQRIDTLQVWQKRTRQLMAGARPLLATSRNKATVQSLREIATGKVRFDRSVRDALAGKFDREKPVAAATPTRSK